MGAAQSGPMSGQMRVAIAAGYTILLAVNGIFGSGAFGVPTNAEVSDAYPTNVTPAGLTFAIWGPIFLLQGVGCVEINPCVGCTRQFFTKSFRGDDAAVLARSSGEEPAPPRRRAGIMKMAYGGRRDDSARTRRKI